MSIGATPLKPNLRGWGQTLKVTNLVLSGCNCYKYFVPLSIEKKVKIKQYPYKEFYGSVYLLSVSNAYNVGTILFLFVMTYALEFSLLYILYFVFYTSIWALWSVLTIFNGYCKFKYKQERVNRDCGIYQLGPACTSGIELSLQNF